MTQLSSQTDIPDFAWVAAAIVALCFVVYFWTRRRTRAAAAAAAAELSEEPAAASEPPADASEPAPLSVPSAPPSSPSASPPSAAPTPVSAKELPRLEFEDEDDIDSTKIGDNALQNMPELQVPTKKIIYDEDAEIEERTAAGALILVTGTAQTDRGLKRQRNEDAILAMPDRGVYVVADGMGGYRGGAIASALAVEAIEGAFETEHFDGQPHEGIPRRASELARAIQMANAAILKRAQSQRELAGMGTTICAARFSSNKQRLYVGHVGDSRMYRLRNGELTQLTSDHTMSDLGVKGAAASHLSRAVGVWPTVPVDIVLCRPRPRDLYLLCSDGLTKMVSDALIGQILHPSIPPTMVVEALIDVANRKGGKDNISAIVIRVDDAATSDAAA